MADKFLTEKRRLREYLTARNVEHDEKNNKWRCPVHEDDHPSAHLHEELDPPLLNCPVCLKSWSVIDIAGILDGLTDFKDMLKSVRKTLNINPKNHESPETGPELQGSQSPAGVVPPSPSSGPVSEDSLPFKILGIGDDGKAAFVSEAGRLVKYGLDGLSKSKLMVLAGRWFWRDNYSGDGKMSWDWAIDEIIRFSQNKDFNEADVRGRGAWRDGDKISYHDGVKTYGEYDKNKIYERLPLKDIGINDEPASGDLREKIRELVFSLSFDTRADALRCLAWSSLAPFAGALKYRPAMLLTGNSGTGKTEVQKKIMIPIGFCYWFDTRVTTTAGIRGKIKRDSTSAIFDEAGKEGDKMKKNFDDIIAFVRSNYSENSPDGVKGTKDGGFVSYKMNSMFALASTDPTIENIQDENRILRINFITPKMTAGEWQKCETELNTLFSYENCKKIASCTWKNLKNIEQLATRIVIIAKTKNKRDYRSSYAEMLLASAYMIIWANIPNPTDEQITKTLDQYYKYQPAEDHRDEAGEFIDRILEEPIEILHDREREKLSVMECMNRVFNEGIIEGDDGFYSPDKCNNYRLALSRYGIIIRSRSLEYGEIAICNNHNAIKKITGCGTGYDRIFERHAGFVIKKNIHFLDGKSRRSTVIRDLLNKQERKTPEESAGFPVERLDFQ